MTGTPYSVTSSSAGSLLSGYNVSDAFDGNQGTYWISNYVVAEWLNADIGNFGMTA